MAAADIAIEYTESGQVMDFAIYTKPYILTNHVVSALDPQTDIENLSMQINAYGPAGCDTVIYFDKETLPAEILGDGSFADPVENVDFSISIGKTTLTASIVESTPFFDEILAHRQTVPEATSAPQTAAHVQEAKIYHDNVFIADIYPANDTRLIKFSDNPNRSYDFVSQYRNIATTTYPLPIDNTVGVILSLMALFQDNTAVEVKEVVSLQYLTQCEDASGVLMDGYYYYADQDVMVSTYCLDGYDTCGEYNYTGVDGLDLYFRTS